MMSENAAVGSNPSNSAVILTPVELQCSTCKRNLPWFAVMNLPVYYCQNRDCGAYRKPLVASTPTTPMPEFAFQVPR